MTKQYHIQYFNLLQRVTLPLIKEESLYTRRPSILYGTEKSHRVLYNSVLVPTLQVLDSINKSVRSWLHGSRTSFLLSPRPTKEPNLRIHLELHL